MNDLIERIETFTVPPRWTLVRVTTDTGRHGWGEAIVPKRREAVLGAIADLTRNLTGTDAGRIEETWHRMRRGGFFRDGPVLATAAAAIDHALWDIKARRLDVPVHGQLRRYDETGHLDEVIEVPANRVTSCAFGGADLGELYLTTGWFGMAADEREPLAGALFRLRPGVAGKPPHLWRPPA